MARKPRFDDDDYDYEERPLRQQSRGIGAAMVIGALAGLVGGEGFLILTGIEGMKPLAGPGAVLLAWGLCFLTFLLAPVFVLLGITGGIVAARTQSTILGIVIGAAAGPLLVFVLWGCGAIEITVNGQPVKFNIDMAWWCSARLWIPGAVGALFAGLLVPRERSDPPPSRGRRRRIDDDEEDDRDYRRRR